MSINVWNARSYNGDWMDMAIPGGTGILAELALFFFAGADHGSSLERP
jgi:hypothetical protein